MRGSQRIKIEQRWIITNIKVGTFENTDSRSPSCGEGPKRCRRCRSHNDADDRRPRSAELMAESNPAESSGRIGSEGDWLKRSGKVGVR